MKSLALGGTAFAVGGGGGLAYGRHAGTRASQERSTAGLAPGRSAQFGSVRTVYSVNTDEPLVALTFDDGPDPRFTPRVLDELAARDLRATFFMMGHNVQAHRDLVGAVVTAGHEVGNHSWSHLDNSTLDQQRTAAEIREAHRVISEATGREPCLFRPPRGRVTGTMIKTSAKLGYDLIMWSITGTVQGPSAPAAVADHVVGSLFSGAIVLLHDGVGRGTFSEGKDWARELVERRTSEIDGLGEILDRGLDAGFRFVTIGELLAAETVDSPEAEAI